MKMRCRWGRSRIEKGLVAQQDSRASSDLEVRGSISRVRTSSSSASMMARTASLHHALIWTKCDLSVAWTQCRRVYFRSKLYSGHSARLSVCIRPTIEWNFYVESSRTFASHTTHLGILEHSNCHSQTSSETQNVTSSTPRSGAVP